MGEKLTSLSCSACGNESQTNIRVCNKTSVYIDANRIFMIFSSSVENNFMNVSN